MCDDDFGNQKPNKRLLDKETSIKLFNETMDRELEWNSEYSRSENFDVIVDELFSMDKVHVAMNPADYNFDKIIARLRWEEPSIPNSYGYIDLVFGRDVDIVWEH